MSHGLQDGGSHGAFTCGVLDRLDWFGNEEACQSYLERLRWPDGFACPSCGHREIPYRASRLRLMCRQCSHQASITAGTIFDRTRTPLRVWFAAAWYLTNQKQGVSALGLQRVLGLGSYQTAWTMLHRLRRAMLRPDRDSSNRKDSAAFVCAKSPKKPRHISYRLFRNALRSAARYPPMVPPLIGPSQQRGITTNVMSCPALIPQPTFPWPESIALHHLSSGG